MRTITAADVFFIELIKPAQEYKLFVDDDGATKCEKQLNDGFRQFTILFIRC